MKTYQIYDQNGIDKGTIQTISISEACRKARQIYEFPILIEMASEDLISFREVMDAKDTLEEQIKKQILDRIKIFEKVYKVRITELTANYSGFCKDEPSIWTDSLVKMEEIDEES